jgi:predicted house-cleaning noncanonical NTP pyrophosphatase (MazG superfamily)
VKRLQKIDIVPFSNNTLSQRIYNISSYEETTVEQRLKESQYYVLQLDELTDVANLAILLDFVRYINEDTGIAEEELLLCRPLRERTTGEEIFHLTMPALLKTKQIGLVA